METLNKGNKILRDIGSLKLEIKDWENSILEIERHQWIKIKTHNLETRIVTPNVRDAVVSELKKTIEDLQSTINELEEEFTAL